MKLAIKIPLFALALLLIFPFFTVDASVFFPYITGKAMFIKICVLLSFILFVSWFIYNLDYRKEVLYKIKALYKNRIFLSVFSFIGIFFLSTILALSRFRAFFGDTERGEGFLGMSFLFGFFFISAIVFEKKDWLLFFKLNLISGAVLFFHSLFQYFGGEPRPSSFTGNPIYLAAYFLFVIFSALIIIREFYVSDRKDENRKNLENGLWLWLSYFSIAFSLAGIFISQTRGVIVGIFSALLLVLIYFAFLGKDIYILKKFNLRKISLTLLILLVCFFSILFLTRDQSFWERVPGLSRIVKTGPSDPTLRTRLISAGVGLESINPSNNGIKTFLIGWGPENFSIAYNKYYNPSYYKYENSWFDRAHNKLIDVLVMNGILGLLSYLLIWILLAWFIFSRKFSFENAIILFFGSSYFIQNLFVFDSISTYVSFFAFLSFAVYLSLSQESPKEKEENFIDRDYIFAKTVVYVFVFGSITAFFAMCFLQFTLAPYRQMKGYMELLSSAGSKQEILDSIDKYVYPFTSAQENIRVHFLSNAPSFIDGGVGNKIFDKAVGLMEDLLARDEFNPRNYLYVGQIFGSMAVGSGIEEMAQNFYKESDFYYKKALNLAPKRQDLIYAASLNLALWGKDEEVLELLDKMEGDNPDVGDVHFFKAMVLRNMGEKYYPLAVDSFERAFGIPNFRYASDSKNDIKSAFVAFIEYFYKTRNKNYFIRSAKMIAKLDIVQATRFEEMIGFADKGEWEKIGIK